jgi:enoyl-CoA hydratase/carnithine racemase
MIKTERVDAIYHITLDRPEKRNALSFEMCRLLCAAFDEAGSNPEVRAIVITANGAAFCAGMDLNEVDSVDHRALARLHDSLFTVGDRMTKPIVAAVNGDALAGGTGLVANAHIVVAGPRVAFGLTEIKIGLWPFMVFRSVARAIGERRATEWSLTGRVIDVEEAKTVGLVHKICKNPYETAFEIAKAMTQASAIATRAGLGYIQQSRGVSWEESGRIAERLRAEVVESAEFRAGLEAFREKRARVKGTAEEFNREC